MRNMKNIRLIAIVCILFIVTILIVKSKYEYYTTSTPSCDKFIMYNGDKKVCFSSETYNTLNGAPDSITSIDLSNTIIKTIENTGLFIIFRDKLSQCTEIKFPQSLDKIMGNYIIYETKIEELDFRGTALTEIHSYSINKNYELKTVYLPYCKINWKSFEKTKNLERIVMVGKQPNDDEILSPISAGAFDGSKFQTFFNTNINGEYTNLINIFNKLNNGETIDLQLDSNNNVYYAHTTTTAGPTTTTTTTAAPTTTTAAPTTTTTTTAAPTTTTTTTSAPTTTTTTAAPKLYPNIIYYGDVIKINHNNTNRRLHSHNIKSNHRVFWFKFVWWRFRWGWKCKKEPSYNEVSCFGGYDDNDWWIITSATNKTGMVWNGDIIRLKHQSTGKYLTFRNDYRSATTNQGFVGSGGIAGRWVIKNRYNNNTNITLNNIITFRASNNTGNLHSHGRRYKCWGSSRQQEVTLFGGWDSNDNWKIIKKNIL